MYDFISGIVKQNMPLFLRHAFGLTEHEEATNGQIDSALILNSNGNGNSQISLLRTPIIKDESQDSVSPTARIAVHRGNDSLENFDDTTVLVEQDYTGLSDQSDHLDSALPAPKIFPPVQTDHTTNEVDVDHSDQYKDNASSDSIDDEATKMHPPIPKIHVSYPYILLISTLVIWGFISLNWEIVVMNSEIIPFLVFPLALFPFTLFLFVRRRHLKRKEAHHKQVPPNSTVAQT